MTTEPKPKKARIIAAGAVVWRDITFGSEIAVIHRTRYGEEWCLPKGKYNKEPDDGSLEKTALREVQEETGCSVKILYFADILPYFANGKKKLVFFWHMQLIEEYKFKIAEETDHLVWLPPEVALRILTHKNQRKLIRKSSNHKSNKFRLNLFNWFKSNQYIRLHGSLLSYKSELESRIFSSMDRIKNDTGWINAIRILIKEAETQLNLGNYDEGWKCFHAAQRMEIFGLVPTELLSKASTIINEAEKLSEWRKKTIYQLLGTPDNSLKMPDAEQVYQAALLRDEHFNNQAYKARLVKSHIGLLGTIILITGILFLILYCFNVISFDSSDKNFDYDSNLIPGIILFGLLGGAFSAALKLPSSIQSTRIPELTQSFQLTTLRVFIGAVSAFIIFLFLKSDFIGSIFNLSGVVSNIFTLYAIAFAAGFSERFVLKAVEAVAM